MNEGNREERYCECVILLDSCIREGLLSKDPNNQDNILIYRSEGKDKERYPEGWYSENILTAASELVDDDDGFQFLQERLFSLMQKEHEISFNPKDIRHIDPCGSLFIVDIEGEDLEEAARRAGANDKDFQDCIDRFGGDIRAMLDDENVPVEVYTDIDEPEPFLRFALLEEDVDAKVPLSENEQKSLSSAIQEHECPKRKQTIERD